MMKQQLIKLVFIIFIILSHGVLAETYYVIDQLTVGLHEENSTDSPIVEMIRSGTPLEVIKTETSTSQVKLTDGRTGWIDNRFLVDTPPAINLVQNLRQKIRKLEAQAESNPPVQPDETTQEVVSESEKDIIIQSLRQQNATLEQQVKSEKLKAGELQINLAELRNQLTAVVDQRQMQMQEEAETESEPEQATEQQPVVMGFLRLNDWKYLAIYLVLALVIGFTSGIFLLDLHNRRRHGGFRI